MLLALLLGLLAPGAGHVLFGRRDKAVFFFCALMACFLVGLWLGEWRCVHVEKFPLYTLAQMWLGLPFVLTALATHSLRITHDIAYLDAGLLMTSVAGLLNVVVLVDLYETHLKIRFPPSVEDAGKKKAAGAKS